MNDSQAIGYRRLVASVARELNAEEVKLVSYIWLTGEEDISKYTSIPPTASGLDLLATLERLGLFSQENVEGLVDIAKDVKRQDLVKKVENYRKNQKGTGTCARKKQRGLPSEERQQLEETFEMIVTQFAVLEQRVYLLQRALDGEQEEEAMEVLRGTVGVVQDMGSKLSEAHERLARRSPDSSNSSDSGSRPDSVEDTAPHQNTAMGPVSSLSDNQPHINSPQPQLASVPQRRKPVAKPRKSKPPHTPIQETVEQSSATAQQQPQLPVECEDDKTSRKNTKPPIPPRRCLLSSETLRTKNLLITHHMPAGEGTADSDDDMTGDSGMGTGSAQYEEVQAWRQALHNPPPDSKEHTYQELSLDTRETDCEYQHLHRKPKINDE